MSRARARASPLGPGVCPGLEDSRLLRANGQESEGDAPLPRSPREGGAAPSPPHSPNASLPSFPR